MRAKKEFSKCCRMCGEEWKEDFSNKYPKKAVCYPCHKIEYDKAKAKHLEKYKDNPNRFDLLKPYKIENRRHIHREVNQKIKPLKDREEIKEFIRKRFDELLLDTAL